MDGERDNTDNGALTPHLILGEHFHHYDIYVVDFVDNLYFPVSDIEKLLEIMACDFKYNLLQIAQKSPKLFF